MNLYQTNSMKNLSTSLARIRELESSYVKDECISNAPNRQSGIRVKTLYLILLDYQNLFFATKFFVFVSFTFFHKK